MLPKTGLPLLSALSLAVVMVLAIAACGPTAVPGEASTPAAGEPGTLPETGGGTAIVTVEATSAMTGTEATAEPTDTVTVEATTSATGTVETGTGATGATTGTVTGTVGITSTPATSAGSEPPTITFIGLTVREGAFDKATIEVQAGMRVVVKFTNYDSEPHNFAVYRDATAQEPIFIGEPITGPGEYTSYIFVAPEPGTYHFQSDDSPSAMFGTLIVR